MNKIDITRQARSITGAIDRLAAQHQAFVDRAVRRVVKLESELAAAKYQGLHLDSLLGPLCGGVEAHDVSWSSTSLFLAGSGPWARETLAQFLSERGFDLVDEPGTNSCIVLGSQDLDEDLLTSIADLDQGEGLSLFSQELFVLGLVRDCDPFELLEDEPVEQIADSHPSIQFLLQAGVRWPSSPAWRSEDGEQVALSGGKIDVSGYEEYEWQSQSVLSRFGYSAKAGALTAKQRRGALDRAMSADLQGVASTSELDRFGPPNHARRLAALVYHMLWLNRFQSADKPDAQGRRLLDLQWLQSKYDPEQTRFRWPDLDERPVNAAAKRVPNAAFMKPLTPSPQLAAVVGSTPLPRTEVVSKLWAYIKKHKLQDSLNKRMVNADPKLQAIFGKTQVSMFEMAGLVDKHVR